MRACLAAVRPVAIALVLTTPLSAQASAAAHVAAGVAAVTARAPGRALMEFRAAIALDSRNFQANWRAAMALIDLGQRTPDAVRSAARDSLYAEAEWYARRAVAASPDSAEGHFALAVAVGRASLSAGKKARVRRAGEVRIEALRALSINPRHEGAYHVLGRWNAEVMRLSGFSRFVAKGFLGGAVLGRASWQEAIDDMRRAVQLNPRRITHRLDLAGIYVDQKLYPAARAQLDTIARLPVVDYMDPVYKQDAARLLRSLRR